MTENEISYKVIGLAIELHKNLGPGLLESAYEAAFMYELRNVGLKVENQKNMPLAYKEIELEVGYRIDLLIEDKLIVELKSVEHLKPLHFAQLLTYLRLSNCKLGLLINFNSKLIKEQIHRVVKIDFNTTLRQSLRPLREKYE